MTPKNGILRVHRLETEEFFCTPINCEDLDFLLDENFKRFLKKIIPIGNVRLFQIFQIEQQIEIFFQGELVYTYPA